MAIRSIPGTKSPKDRSPQERWRELLADPPWIHFSVGMEHALSMHSRQSVANWQDQYPEEQNLIVGLAGHIDLVDRTRCYGGQYV